jgi:hypothetical protein
VPFHGWRWGPDGTNCYIPYQPDRPNKALRLRVYPVRAQFGCVFVWHQPDGKEPQCEMPDLFHKFPQFDTDPDAYYCPYPEFSRRAEHEPVHPQIVAENGPDSAHFHHVHGATVTPVCLNWEAVDEEWQFLTGWPDARSDDPDRMALYIHSHFSGLGFVISVFEGSSNHRLIFACTPVEDGYSDVPPDPVREQVDQKFLGTVWDDLDIWRYQEYVEHPALSKVDAKLYMAMRKWATQFYDVPATRSVRCPRRYENDLADIVAPAHTAIVTQECQGAVVGPNAGLAVLAEEARREAVPNIERLLPAARDAGVKVVHCLVQKRADGLGANHNAKIFAIGRGVDIIPGSRRCCPNSGPRQPMWCSAAPTASGRWAAPISTRPCATSASRPSSPSASRSMSRLPTSSWTR